MNLSFHFEHDHAKNIIIIKKKGKKEKERSKFSERCNIKKYYNKGKFQHFSFNVFEDFRIIKFFDLNTYKFEKTLFITFVY